MGLESKNPARTGFALSNFGTDCNNPILVFQFPIVKLKLCLYEFSTRGWSWISVRSEFKFRREEVKIIFANCEGSLLPRR